MLSHVSNNYSSLQMHLLTLMQQQQQNQASEPAHEREVIKFSILFHKEYMPIK